MAESEHLVQFYDDDAHLIESVSNFLGSGLRIGAGCIVMATPEHRLHFGAHLRARGFDLDDAAAAGQYIALDAQTILTDLIVDGSIDPDRFDETIGPVLGRAELRYPSVVAFGEMVALLCLDGKYDMAISLEMLWNELSARHDFSLLCAYPRNAFPPGERIAIGRICSQHSGFAAVPMR